MRKIAVILLLGGLTGPGQSASAQSAGSVLTGAAAFGDWTMDAPGVRRLIRASDIPKPFAPPAAVTGNAPQAGTGPKLPPGFTATVFAQLKSPRLMRVAPNGDIFVAETAMGQVRVLRAADGAATPSENAVFASGLTGPFGIAFYPAGSDPQFVYIANQNSVVRFPYRSGDLTARGAAEPIVPALPIGGHSTRDIVFSPDGGRLYISVGSGSNVAESMHNAAPAKIHAAEAAYGPGASWDDEAERADVLYTKPDGSGGLHSFANGIRNCVGMALQPVTNDLWCATNERDMLGDNLPPDYATHVTEGAFYGWPWYYTGGNEDPRHKGERPELANKVTVPDVLIQPHSAPLQIAFYTGSQFPAEYRGDAFIALHGSWNRSTRTGYKVVRAILKNGKPTGEYEDFMTGMIAGNQKIIGRPVGVAVAHDGSLLVSEDSNGTVWRIAYGETGVSP